jgi:hypothetical protein
MYEAAEAWGGNDPFGVPLFVVTHRPEDEPAEGGFTFVNGLDEAIARAREAADGKDVSIGGGADVIRQGAWSGVRRSCCTPRHLRPRQPPIASRTVSSSLALARTRASSWWAQSGQSPSVGWASTGCRRASVTMA